MVRKRTSYSVSTAVRIRLQLNESQPGNLFAAVPSFMSEPSTSNSRKMTLFNRSEHPLTPPSIANSMAHPGNPPGTCGTVSSIFSG